MTERLYWQQFYANRNATNNRLDHILTCIGSPLIDIILSDNHLIEIDLANSQFSILAYILGTDESFRSTSDFKLFQELTSTGKLYNYIQEHFDLNSLQIAKEMMMELAFSSHKYYSPYKKKLRDLFPTVVANIDNFKKQAVAMYGEKAHKRFAISLQKKEAEIFIDGIYSELKKRGLWCITKHDSLLVKYRDAEQVQQFVREYFQSIDFACTIRVK